LRSDAGKTKIPSIKHQIPNKFQVPNANDPNEGQLVLKGRKREDRGKGKGKAKWERISEKASPTLSSLILPSGFPLTPLCWEIGAWNLVLQSSQL
jgi:hypothetical protein